MDFNRMIDQLREQTAMAAPSPAPYVGTTEQWLRGAMEISQEVAEFTCAQLEEGAAAWMGLFDCRSPLEAFEWQHRVVTRASEEYLAESGRIARMMSSLTRLIAAEEESAPRSY